MLVVGKHVKTTAFNEVAEMFVSFDDSEEFSVVCGVIGFGFVKLLREEGD